MTDSENNLLPLFPLGLVLFPRMPLQLHIFEPRYQEMIAACLDDKQPFGVLFASEAGIATIGCAAIVAQVLQRYTDGEFDILCAGINRFEVEELNTDKAYLRGRVGWFDDERETTEATRERLVERVLETFGRIAPTEQAVRDLGKLLRQAGSTPSFALAPVLGALDERLASKGPFLQGLLQQRSEGRRLRAILRHLERLAEEGLSLGDAEDEEFTFQDVDAAGAEEGDDQAAAGEDEEGSLGRTLDGERPSFWVQGLKHPERNGHAKKGSPDGPSSSEEGPTTEPGGDEPPNAGPDSDPS